MIELYYSNQLDNLKFSHIWNNYYFVHAYAQ